MKLQNKKTGGLATLVENEDCLTLKTDAGFHHYFSLAQLNEEWEDYEEPKEYWAIDCFVPDGDLVSQFSNCSESVIENRKSIGNYFETKEEAEKAVEKLKAWKRLKDKGFVWQGWEEGAMDNGMCVIGCQIPENNWETDVVEDLDLLFGGEK